jgi:hypothetical protein
MSMSTHIIGFVPPDEEWKKMKAVYDACVEAGVDLPRGVEKYFDGTEPQEEGKEIDLTEDNYNGLIVEPWEGDCCSGYQIELKKLPKNVKIIRFYNSY